MFQISLKLFSATSKQRSRSKLSAFSSLNPYIDLPKISLSLEAVCIYCSSKYVRPSIEQVKPSLGSTSPLCWTNNHSKYQFYMVLPMVLDACPFSIPRIYQPHWTRTAPRANPIIHDNIRDDIHYDMGYQGGWGLFKLELRFQGRGGDISITLIAYARSAIVEH